MTDIQWVRFKDFAERAAKTWYSEIPLVLSLVKEFIDSIEYAKSCLKDWDGSEPWPEGSPYHGIESVWYCKSKVGECKYSKCKNGKHERLSAPFGVGDFMSKFEWDVIHYHHTELNKTEKHWFEVNRELDNYDSADEIHREADERISTPVRCCVRSALDIASSPSAGVIGFTAGDIRSMYPEGVPDWVKGDQPWGSKRFDEIEDDEPVWI